MSLKTYNAKRNFNETTEPEGKSGAGSDALIFVVQRHDASRLHWDFRLELDGTLKSWAVPKGPSLNPADKRLAVQVEDHPVSYATFEGDIPEGNYGAGHVDIWDHGSYEPINQDGATLSAKDALAAWTKGHLRIRLAGRRLKGEFQIFRMHDRDKNWLLLKINDAYAIDGTYDPDGKIPARKSPEAVKPATAKKPADEADDKSRKKFESFVKPMTAVLHDAAFDDPDWIFEIKWDGYRAVAECGGDGGTSRLYSRNGLNFGDRYADIFKAVSGFKTDMVLDGEIVAFDKNGNPAFQLIQNAGSNAAELVYYVFDLLRLNGESLEGLPLTNRKELLRAALPENDIVRYCDHVAGDGKDFFSVMTKRGLEGMIAKKATSLYVEGARSPEWLKIKHLLTDEAVIAGYTAPRGQRERFGALILGEYQNGRLVYIGHAGTGFTRKTLDSLFKSMQPYVQEESPFDVKIPVNAAVTWLKPALVANVKFTGITDDGIRRHPVFMGLREDKAPEEVNRADAAQLATRRTTQLHMDDNILKAGRHKVAVSNIEKIYWPDEGFTKGDLLNYYATMSKHILPYLKGRPLSLLRNPNGIRDRGFFQKDAGDAAPDFVETVRIEHEESSVNYVMANNVASLLYLANLGCIEMNPWHSKAVRQEHPDYMMIDLDPAAKNTFDQVVETAKAVKEVLDIAGIKGYCKTSGSSGLHIYVPLAAKYHYDQVLQFAEIIALRTQELVPDFTSLERSLKKRGNNIYIDYFQNRVAQTIASAYSVRPKPHATVSAPLDWKEVRKGLDMQRFTMKTMPKRLEQKGDLFRPVLGRGIDMEKALRKLGG